MRPLELMATLSPSFEHFPDFVRDARLNGGVRLNSAMMLTPSDIRRETAALNGIDAQRYFFDAKGRQLRILEVDVDRKRREYLHLVLNHPIQVETPITVRFKGGMDSAKLDHLEDGGTRLVFQGDGKPRFALQPGESICIRDPSLRVLGPLFTDAEKAKLAEFRRAGCRRWFLSFVEQGSDVDEFRELVGHDADIRLKIESIPGMRYVEHDFVKRDGLSLVAARGDLFIELAAPADIITAMKTIIARDPEATVGSRILLSVQEGHGPSCADLSELDWLYGLGYRRMMLCDEMCLRRDTLEETVQAFEAFRRTIS